MNEFPSLWQDNSILVSIDLGIDESGPIKSILVLSAIAGQTSLMKKFHAELCGELRDLGIDYFHAKEHRNKSSKPYRKASMTKRKRLLSSLVSNIYKFSSFGLSVSINVDEYKSLTTPRFRSQFGSPYSFAIQAMLEAIYGMMDVTGNTHETVNVLIEDGHKNSAGIMQKLEALKKHEAPLFKLGCYGLGSKKDWPILQAADLLAYGSSQYINVKRSEMLKKLIFNEPQRFLHLPCDAEIISYQQEAIRGWFRKRKEIRYAEYLSGLKQEQ